ncbi:MAG: nitrous oxide reductase family maturation protein NosD [Chitinophagaceae bacterium]|nr:nitrous oxide reductase family maturation protein NosD [Chitinophagaceae bacterium]
MRWILTVVMLMCGYFHLAAMTITVGKDFPIKSINRAIAMANDGDTVLVHEGLYREGNILVNKSISVIGKNKPILDGQKKFEVVTIRASHVMFDGFVVQHSGYATLEDPGGIKVYNAYAVTISNNILEDNFFGIYIHYGRKCLIKNNRIRAYGVEEQQIGNGIHCWKSDSMEIIGNVIRGHRDGIYFEFVTNSIIWRNVSESNIRYGLHFMFSNHDAYITNIFRRNGSGVAVMFTKEVNMFNNYFEDNWGDAAYGILLKEISDSYIIGNHFKENTAALYLEGANRIIIEKNEFQNNGWGMKIQASCMDNVVSGNNFIGNTFDISTNGSLVLSTFNNNYWDKYEGYDLDRNGIGDVPFHPLSLFAMIAEKNPPVMLLFRSFMVNLLDRSEKMMPSLTPENFIDEKPMMKPCIL